MTERVAIAGVGMTSFGKFLTRSVRNAVELLRRGATELGGTLSDNPSGGLLSRGHPIGATATAQIFELDQQLRGEAGQRQSAKVALAPNSGGQVGGDSAAAVVSILVV